MNKAGQKNVNAEETEVIEKRLPLFQNTIYLVQAEADGIRCFHCKSEEANKWHVFGGEVSCVSIFSIYLSLCVCVCFIVDPTN